MQEIIELYEEPEIIETILHSNDYIKFIINECTLEALKNKADFIMSCNDHIWKPLCIIGHHPSISVYDKIFYLNKKISPNYIL